MARRSSKNPPACVTVGRRGARGGKVEVTKLDPKCLQMLPTCSLNGPMGAAATRERQREGAGGACSMATPSSTAALVAGGVIGGVLRPSHLRAAGDGHGRPSALAARGSACGGGLPEAGAGGVLQRRGRGQVRWEERGGKGAGGGGGGVQRRPTG